MLRGEVYIYIERGSGLVAGAGDVSGEKKPLPVRFALLPGLAAWPGEIVIRSGAVVMVVVASCRVRTLQKGEEEEEGGCRLAGGLAATGFVRAVLVLSVYTSTRECMVLLVYNSSTFPSFQY